MVLQNGDHIPRGFSSQRRSRSEDEVASAPQSLLQLKDGRKSYGARALFSDASFAINAGEKVGVIGPNGAGKSTLFRILVGQESMDSGDITRANGLRVGYLAQEEQFRWKDVTVEQMLASQTATPSLGTQTTCTRIWFEPRAFLAPDHEPERRLPHARAAAPLARSKTRSHDAR